MIPSRRKRGCLEHLTEEVYGKRRAVMEEDEEGGEGEVEEEEDDELADEDEAEDSEEEVVPGHLTSYYENTRRLEWSDAYTGYSLAPSSSRGRSALSRLAVKIGEQPGGHQSPRCPTPPPPSLHRSPRKEAVHMARDFAHVCEKEFHSREFAIHLSKAAHLGSPAEHSARRMSLHAARQMVEELLALLACDRSPLTTSVAPPRGMLDPHLQQHLSHFSLVTHGFGVVAMQAVLTAIRSVLDESVRILERPPPHPYLLKHDRIL